MCDLSTGLRELGSGHCSILWSCQVGRGLSLELSFVQTLRKNSADTVDVQVHKMPGMTRPKDTLLVTNKQEPRGTIVNFHQFISICLYPLNYPEFI